MEIKARIPGTIIAVNAAVGDTVKARGGPGHTGGHEDGAAHRLPH